MIRAAGSTDAAAIAAVQIAGWRAAYRDIVPIASTRPGSATGRRGDSPEPTVLPAA